MYFFFSIKLFYDLRSTIHWSKWNIVFDNVECKLTFLWFLVNEQRDAQFFSTYLFSSLTLRVSSASCLSSGETNCVNTTSGSHSVLVAVSCAHDTVTNTEWHLPEVVLTQFVSPDDEHDVLEACRELKIKNKYTEKNNILLHVRHLPGIITWCTVNKI